MLRPPQLALALLLLVTGCQGAADRAAAPSPTASPSASPTLSPSPSATPSVTPSATPSPSPAAPRTPAPAPRPVVSPRTRVPYTVLPVTAADLPHSWHPGCPVAPSQLRLLVVPYVGFDGVRHRGRIVVNARAVQDVAHVLTTLYAESFPIRSMRPVDEFGGSDDASMAADNTSAFNCRQAVGGSGWSMHAYGLAIDVDPRENPYLEGGQVRPPEGEPYVDRRQSRPGMVHAGDRVVRAFAAVGWQWGGRWTRSPDYQHFSSNGG